MRKRNLVLALGLCVALGLVGCGKKDPVTNETPTPTVAQSDGTSDNDSPQTSVTPAVDENGIIKFKGEVEVGNYKGIEVKKAKAETTDTEVETTINNFLTSKATNEEIKDRTDVQEGDIANIDYEGKMDGKVFDNGSDKAFDLTIGSGSFIPGFEDQLIGAKVGETKDINITFPDPYDTNPDFSGKEAVFTVKINSISKSVVPELTDAFVKENTDYETIDAYKKGTKDTIQAQKEQTAQNDAEYAIWKAIIDNTKFTGVDQSEIDAQEAGMRQQYESYATAYGLDFAMFLAYFMGMTEEQFTAETKTAADFSVRQRLVLDKIVEIEKVTLTEDEYKVGAEKYAKDNQFATLEEFETSVGKNKIEFQLICDKAAAIVIDSAVITVE